MNLCELDLFAHLIFVGASPRVLLFRFFLLLSFGSLTNSGADIKTER